MLKNRHCLMAMSKGAKFVALHQNAAMSPHEWKGSQMAKKKINLLKSIKQKANGSTNFY